MKQSGKCPKCGGTSLGKSKPKLMHSNIGVMFPLAFAHGHVPLTRYVCLDCGYSEAWVDEDKDLARLRKRFGKG